MEIFPAIDLKNGEVVRLTQGDYDKVQVYSQNPAAIAAQFREQGAKNLHVVDLDGARDGDIANLDAIRAIVGQGGLFTQLGGGIRDEARIKGYLDLGIDRVILGTVAVENFAFLEKMITKYGDKIAVGVDARDGKIAVKGWRELTQVDAIGFCQRLEQAGVSTIIYTDISKDGAMSGTNLEIYRLLAATVRCNIIASGGICFAREIEELKTTGTYGAIIGKALYTGTLTLQEVLGLC